MFRPSFSKKGKETSMKGLVLINAYPNGEKFINQGVRIAEELKGLGVDTDVLKNGEIWTKIDKKGNVSVELAETYGFVVYLDKDKYLGKLLEKAGIRLYNSASAVEICDDKMLTYISLVKKNIPLAETIPAPLCYTPNAKTDETFLKNIAETLGLPLVVKKSYGSFGAGVTLVKTWEELQRTAQEHLYTPHFYQRYISESSGKDIRVIVIGGIAVAAMERVAQKGEFRSNIELGGVGRAIALPKEYQTVAENAAKSLNLDYCGVDLLETKDGPILCEVNSNAFFEGLEKTTGVNVARAYAEYIVKDIQKS